MSTTTRKMSSTNGMKLWLVLLFCLTNFSGAAAAQDPLTWRINGSGTYVIISNPNGALPATTMGSQLIFGANLPESQQFKAYVERKTSNEIWVSLVANQTVSGTMKYVPNPDTDPSKSYALAGKLLYVHNPTSCTAAGFTAKTVGSHEYCVFPNNFTQGASDYLLVGSTLSSQVYYPIITSDYIKSTGNQVTLNNVVLTQDPSMAAGVGTGALKVNYTQVTNGAKDTLNITGANIGGWVFVQGDLNISGIFKTVGYGAVAVSGGTMNINSGGNLWMNTNETDQLYAVAVFNNGTINNNGGIYQDLKSKGIGLYSGAVVNNAMFHIQSPWGLVASGGSVLNKANGTLNVGSSLKRAIQGIYLYPGGKIINVGTINNNQTNGIYNDGMITNCSTRGTWTGSNASPIAQVTTIVVGCAIN